MEAKGDLAKLPKLRAAIRENGAIWVVWPKGRKELEGAGAAHEQRIKAIWRQCRAINGQGGPFLFGHFTAADAMYAPVATRFRTYGVDLARYGDDGTGATYQTAILGLPAMAEWTAGARQEMRQRSVG